MTEQQRMVIPPVTGTPEKQHPLKAPTSLRIAGIAVLERGLTSGCSPSPKTCIIIGGLFEIRSGARRQAVGTKPTPAQQTQNQLSDWTNTTWNGTQASV